MGLPVMKVDSSGSKQKKRYVRKHEELHRILQKIKLWASRTGTLHGIRSIETKGAYLIITTHCGHEMRMKDSRASRGSRWLRNKWFVRACPECKIPVWKLEKYSSTSFK